MTTTVSTTSEGVQAYVHHLVWLDENPGNNVNEQKLKLLRDLDEKIKTFSDRKQCIDYIQERDDRSTTSYMIFIVSGSLSKEVIPVVQDCRCILAIFIYGTKSEKIEQFKSDIISICTDLNELINRIHACMKTDRSSMEYNLLNIGNTTDTTAEQQQSIRNLKEDEARFLWFYKCHSFMIELKDDDQEAKKEMIAVCRQNYTPNRHDSKILKKFEEESVEENGKNAIWWYTQNSILGQSINEALVSGDIPRIYSYRYLIKLICRQLKTEHEGYKKKYKEPNLRLYRGLAIKPSELSRISQHQNDLISLNGFISTSAEEDVAKRFNVQRKKEGYESVILEIDIDMTSEHSIAFADVHHLSQYPEEEEILLSVGSVFRIVSFQFNQESKLYRIGLSLRQHDQLVVNKYIEQTYPNEGDSTDQSVLFGKLLFDMGEHKFAIKYYKNRMECLSHADNQHRPTYLNNIGVCYKEIGDKDQALRYYKTALRFYEQMKNDCGLGACYHNIASYYYDEKEYENAFKYVLHALEERRDSPLAKAASLDLLGCIQLARDNTDAARDNLQDALKIRLKHLRHINPNHPDIGISYQNLGKLDSVSSLFIDAQQNYQQAARIFRSNYPETHSLMVDITKRLGAIGRRLGN